MKTLICLSFILSAFAVSAQGIVLTPNNPSIESVTNLPLVFRTGGAERLRIISNGDVGIGTAIPQRKLHVRVGSSGVVPNANAEFFFENSVTTYLGIAVPETSETGILFGKSSSGSASGGLIYTAANSLQFRTNTNNTRMTILSNGNVGIGTSPVQKLDIDGNLRLTGEVNRPSTGSNNMIPIAYGRIIDNGGIIAGSGNFTITDNNAGVYEITIENETLDNANYILIATINNTFPGFISAVVIEGGKLQVQTFNRNGTAQAITFSFVVYKE